MVSIRMQMLWNYDEKCWNGKESKLLKPEKELYWENEWKVVDWDGLADRLDSTMCG